MVNLETLTLSIIVTILIDIIFSVTYFFSFYKVFNSSKSIKGDVTTIAKEE